MRRSLRRGRKAGLAAAAAAAVAAAGTLRADVLWLRAKDGAGETKLSGVTVVEDGEALLKYTKGVVSDQIPAERVIRVIYENLPPEFAQGEEAAAMDGAQAASLFVKAAEKSARTPVKVMALLRAGEALFDAGRFAEARERLDKCVAAGPGARLAAAANLRAAQCDFFEKQYDRARDTLKRLVLNRATENEAWRRYWLGRVHAAQGDFDGARAQFEDASRTARNAYPRIFELAEVRLAWLTHRRGPEAAILALAACRAGLSDPAALADYFSLLAGQHWVLSQKESDAVKRQDAQVQAALNALRVVTTLDVFPEPAAAAYDIAAQALLALKDKKAEEIRTEGAKRFGQSGWIQAVK